MMQKKSASMQFPLDTDFFTAGQDILFLFRLPIKLSTCMVKIFRALHARIFSMLFILSLNRLDGNFPIQWGIAYVVGVICPHEWIIYIPKIRWEQILTLHFPLMFCRACLKRPT